MMQGTSPFTPFQHNISPFIIGDTPKASSHKDNLISTPKTEASSQNTQLMEDVTMGMDNLNTTPQGPKVAGQSEEEVSLIRGCCAGR